MVFHGFSHIFHGSSHLQSLRGLGEGRLPPAPGLALERLRRARAPLEPGHLYRGGAAQARGAGAGDPAPGNGRNDAGR